MFSVAVDGDAPLVRAVVVGDVDLLDVALFDGGRPPASRLRSDDERQLGARHAAQVALRLVQLVGHGVRVEPRVRRRAGVLAAVHRLPRPHVIQPHLDADAGRRPSARCRSPRRRRRARASDRTARCRSTPAAGMRLVGVARNHVELALVVQVVPQHLARSPAPRPGSRVGRQRQQIGHRQPRLACRARRSVVTPTLVGCCGGCGGGAAAVAVARRPPPMPRPAPRRAASVKQGKWSSRCLSACIRNTGARPARARDTPRAAAATSSASARAARRNPASATPLDCSTVMSTMRPSF